MTFKPFADSTSSSQIEQLTLENQGDRLSIYGSIQITQDKAGLANAKALQQLINETVQALEHMQLPDKIAAPAAGEEVANPFL